MNEIRGGDLSIRIAAVLLFAMFEQFSASTRAQNLPPQNNPLNPQTERLVCPLSPAQTQKSIDAFAKMVPTFTQEPRCVNCHGGIDPFADPAAHGGGTQDPKSDCDDCHSDMPPKRGGAPSKWRLANPEHFFKGKDAKTLCKQMRGAFPQSVDFIGHLIDDNGNSKFTEVAFLGTRGLNEAGQALVKKYQPEPPKNITQGGLIDLAQDWIAAMGGEFQGDVSCGCEPAQYAVRAYYEAKISIGTVLQQATTMGPVDIPITFHDDHSFAGTGTFLINGAGRVQGGGGACISQSQGSMLIQVSGNAIEEWKNNRMHIEATNLTPTSGATEVQCPQRGANAPLLGGDKAAFGFDLTGRIGEAAMTRVPLPAPGTIAILRVEVVQQDAP
jgi:hypothetical protein